MADEESGDWTPRPDPTTLTTEALIREIAQLKELLEAQINASDEQSRQRYVMAREFLDTQMADHKHAVNERFDALRREMTATMGAQKEAVDKAEAGTTKVLDTMQTGYAKEIDAIRAQIQASNQGQNERLNAVSSRLDRGEGKGSGLSQAGAVAVALGALFLSLLGVGVAAYAALANGA